MKVPLGWLAAVGVVAGGFAAAPLAVINVRPDWVDEYKSSLADELPGFSITETYLPDASPYGLLTKSYQFRAVRRVDNRAQFATVKRSLESWTLTQGDDFDGYARWNDLDLGMQGRYREGEVSITVWASGDPL